MSNHGSMAGAALRALQGPAPQPGGLPPQPVTIVCPASLLFWTLRTLLRLTRYSLTA